MPAEERSGIRIKGAYSFSTDSYGPPLELVLPPTKSERNTFLNKARTVDIQGKGDDHAQLNLRQFAKEGDEYGDAATYTVIEGGYRHPTGLPGELVRE